MAVASNLRRRSTRTAIVPKLRRTGARQARTETFAVGDVVDCYWAKGGLIVSSRVDHFEGESDRTYYLVREPSRRWMSRWIAAGDLKPSRKRWVSPGFNDLDEVKKGNEAIGNFYFSEDTIRFFKSRPDYRVFNGPAGSFFVDSIKPPHGPREYKVRQVRDTGAVDNVEGGFSRLEQARKAAEQMAGAGKQYGNGVTMRPSREERSAKFRREVGAVTRKRLANPSDSIHETPKPVVRDENDIRWNRED